MHKCGVKLGDGIRLGPEFEKIGKYALAGFGVEPGMADYFARYAADHLFDEIDEIGIRDGSDLEIPGAKGISFGFSVWTTIEECNNPAVVFENGEVHTIEPFAELESSGCPRASARSRSATSSTKRSSRSPATPTSSRASRRPPSSTPSATSS